MNMIEKNIKALKETICRVAEKYGRAPDAVKLLAVSKKQTIADMALAWQAGQTAFGENYIQEALPKIIAFSNKIVEWHFIGRIQSNKTHKIAENFAWAHCVTDIRIATRLNEQRPAHLPPLNICIEVNVSHEISKSGINEDEVFALAKACMRLPRLHLRGLMTIPARETNFAKQRSAFQQLANLKSELITQGIQLDTLSMGMSGDFEAAIAEGATIIRIGEMIFGER